MCFTRMVRWQGCAILVWLNLNLLSLFVCCQAAGNPYEKMLRQKLFENYDKSIRPVPNWTDSVHVYLDYSPLYFNGLDGVHQVFSVYGWIGTKYYNREMAWEPSEYDGIRYLTVEASKIWIPDLGVINSVDQLYGDTLERSSDVQGKLYNDGRFRIARAGTWRTTCLMDVSYFPFDKQVCHIEIDSWSVPMPELVLMGEGSELRMNKLRPNGQWKFIKSWLHVQKTETAPDSKYQTLSFVFCVQRKPFYVIMNLIIPCIGILLLELVVFWLPPDAGEKMSLGITLLLAQTVFQLVMQGDMPETSDQFPIITMFILLAMFLSGMEIVCSVVVLNFHFRSDKTRPPRCVRRLFIGCIGRCLGVPVRKPDVTSARLRGENGHDALLTKINGRTGSRRSSGRENSNREEEHDQWIDVAQVIDRLFFLIFLLLTAGITTSLLLLSYYSNEGHEAPLAGYGYAYTQPE